MLTVLLLAILAADAPGTAWPNFEVDTLAGTKIKFPADAAGKTTLVVMGFSKDSGDACRVWVERFTKDGGHAYMAPILEGAPRLVRGLIRSGMRKDIPSSLHARTLLVYSGEAEWKKRTGFQPGTDKQPYLILLDKQGRVQWQRRGNLDEAAYAELRKVAGSL